MKIELDVTITPEDDASVHYLTEGLVHFCDKLEGVKGVKNILIRRFELRNEE